MPTRTLTANRLGDRTEIVTWAGLLNTDDGSPYERVDFPDRSVQVSGTFGTGGTVVIQGTNNGTAWHTLTDPQGNALSFTAAGLEQVQELTRQIRPLVTGGDGTTNLVVTMLTRGGR